MEVLASAEIPVCHFKTYRVNFKNRFLTVVCDSPSTSAKETHSGALYTTFSDKKYDNQYNSFD